MPLIGLDKIVKLGYDRLNYVFFKIFNMQPAPVSESYKNDYSCFGCTVANSISDVEYGSVSNTFVKQHPNIYLWRRVRIYRHEYEEEHVASSIYNILVIAIDSSNQILYISLSTFWAQRSEVARIHLRQPMIVFIFLPHSQKVVAPKLLILWS